MDEDLSKYTKEQLVAMKEKEYGELVNNILSNEYSINDQIAILKHSAVSGTDTDEFKTFVAAGETAKKSAKAFVDEKYDKYINA